MQELCIIFAGWLNLVIVADQRRAVASDNNWRLNLRVDAGFGLLATGCEHVQDQKCSVLRVQRRSPASPIQAFASHQMWGH